MARQVIWSLRAQDDRKKIFTYWNHRNKSNAYSKKLNGLFKEAISLLKKYPNIGRQTTDKLVRVKIVRDYLIIYEATEKEIFILTIWDSRQDPEELTKILNSPK
jgi:plasmid stabilization system protein ParE